jgi:hypothetical protein
MHKFTLVDVPETNPELPVLYKLLFGKMYYLHKGKTLKESADKLLDDVFRGMRDKKCPEAYSNIVKFCNQYRSTHAIKVELVLNAEPAKILRKETALYKSMKKDEMSLNRLDIEPYKPEWMLKAAFQERCENCLKTGLVDGKKVTFKFCPQCGRIIKPS